MKKALMILVVFVLLIYSVSAVGLLVSDDKPVVISIGEQTGFEYIVKGDSEVHQVELFAEASSNGFVNFNGESKYSEVVTVNPFEVKVVDFNIIGEKEKSDLTIVYGFKFLDGGSEGVSFQQVVQDDFVVGVQCVDCDSESVDVVVNFDEEAVKASSVEAGSGSGAGAGAGSGALGLDDNLDVVGDKGVDELVVTDDSGSVSDSFKKSSNNFVSDVPSNNGVKKVVGASLLTNNSKNVFIAFFVSLLVFFGLTVYTYFYVKRSGSV